MLYITILETAAQLHPLHKRGCWQRCPEVPQLPAHSLTLHPVDDSPVMGEKALWEWGAPEDTGGSWLPPQAEELSPFHSSQLLITAGLCVLSGISLNPHRKQSTQFPVISFYPPLQLGFSFFFLFFFQRKIMCLLSINKSLQHQTAFWGFP